MPKPFDTVPKAGDYYLLQDVDVLPPLKVKAPPPPPPVKIEKSVEPPKPTAAPAPIPKVKDPKNLTVWERQALRNFQKENTPPSTELRPRKPTIWEKHAARKAQIEREKEIKDRESRVVHGDLPPPPRLSLIPAFRSYKNNQEIKAKEEAAAASRSQSQDPNPVVNPPPAAAGPPPQPMKRKVSEAKNYNFTFSLYEIIIGAIGGVVVGIESGFFSASRLPTPNVPLPSNSPLTGNFQAGVKQGAILWRAMKRAAISGIMFSILEQQLEQVRNKADWKNSAYSGFICGSLFGIRGGPRGVVVGGLGFTAFATGAAICKYLIPPSK